MKKLISQIKDIWNITALRKKIILTLALMAVYRFMSQVPLPGIDPNQLSALSEGTNSGLLGLLNAFTGGAFSRASVMALGIMPYISASIVMQLMGIAIPYFQKLQADGESGRNKINQITRWLTIGITMVQGPAYITAIKTQFGIPQEAFLVSGGVFWFSSMIILTTGTIFAMWLGERITEKGIGNGTSLIIMIGIIARFPSAFVQELQSRIAGGGGGGFMMILIEIILWLLVILASVLLVTAVRKVIVQYAKRSLSGIQSFGSGSRDYIPLKINSSGVMPIIFGQAIMFVPGLIAQNIQEGTAGKIANSFADMNGLGYNVLFVVLIILFSYFYTAITIPTNKMAEDLKRSNGFIPGINPGKPTADKLDDILSKITFPGSLFLAILAILPSIAVLFGLKQNWAMFYGGTSLIIMVGVAMDTVQQIKSYLLNKNYDGLMNVKKMKY